MTHLDNFLDVLCGLRTIPDGFKEYLDSYVSQKDKVNEIERITLYSDLFESYLICVKAI